MLNSSTGMPSPQLRAWVALGLRGSQPIWTAFGELERPRRLLGERRGELDAGHLTLDKR
jgi:hypothetical protein